MPVGLAQRMPACEARTAERVIGNKSRWNRGIEGDRKQRGTPHNPIRNLLSH